MPEVHSDQFEPRVVKTPSLQIAKNRLLGATAFCAVLCTACSAAAPPLDVDFARQALLGVEQAKIVAADGRAQDIFGASVAISGDTVVMGAPGVDSPGMSDVGAAYVFVRPSGGSTWTQQAKLTADNAELYDRLGSAVLVRGDTVLASAMNRAFEGIETVGAVYVFTRPSGGSMWTQQTMLLPSNKGRYTGLGRSLAMEGNTALFGTYATSNAYVFTRSSDGRTGPSRPS